MRILSKAKELIRKVISGRRLTSSLLATALAGVLMVAGYSVGLAADVPRDFDDNTIMHGGAADADEFCQKAINGDGKNTDLHAVYSHFGVPLNNCAAFADKAKDGTLFRNGEIKVDGQTVASFAKTMGRQNIGNSEEFPIDGKTYFIGTPQERWKEDVGSLPVMVWFDEEGTVKLVIMKPCGNPVPRMEKVTSKAVCKDLIAEEVKDKKDTFRFTTDAEKFGFAEFLKFEYFFDEGDGEKPMGSTESPDTPVEKTFTKDATVRVKITISVPGDQTRVIVDEDCVVNINVKKEEKKPVPVKVLSVKKEKPQPPAKSLPVTGPADLAGLFAGVGAVGAVGHHVYATYRGRRQKK